MAGQYELVLQFPLPPRDVSQFHRVTLLEERLSEPNDLYEVDGHDCRLGLIEIRLLTDDPETAYDRVKSVMPDRCNCHALCRDRESQEAPAVSL